jgi:nuclease-like protein
MTGILGQDQLHRAWSPETVLATLRADPGLLWWARRTAVSITVATVMTVLTDWRIGLTVAAVAATADALYHSRTRAVVPAATRVTSAQRRTRRRLTRLAPSGYISLHARMIPGADSVIDHLVIGPAGVYAVNSQCWDRRLPVRATQGGQLYHGPFDQASELENARWQAGQAGQLIGGALGQPVAVRAAMVIYGPTVPWIVVKVSGVDVFCGRRLRKYLRHEACANRTRRLNERQIELIHAAAAQALPPAR